MSKRLLILITMVITLVGCKQRELTLTPIDSVSYETGYLLPLKPSYFEEDGEEYVGFGNLETKRLVSIFTVEGNLVSVTDTWPAMLRENRYAKGFRCISKDTIALSYTNSTNRLGLINSRGDSIRTYHFSEELKKGYSLNGYFDYKNGKFWSLLHLDIDSMPEEQMPMTHRDYYHLLHTHPRLLVATGDDLENKEFLITTFPSRLNLKENDFTYDMLNIIMEDDRILFCSRYSDSIYICDKHGEIQRMIKTPSHTGKPNKCPTYSNEEYEEYLESTYTKPSIFDFLYDKYRKLYYCIVQDTIYGRDIYDSVQFHMIIYDKDFNERGYVIFDDFKHLQRSAFVGKKGLYIRQNRRDLYRRTKYTIFKCD